MTADEYWYGDPRLLENFEQAFNANVKMKMQDAWISGLYVKSALQSTMIAAIPVFEPRKLSGKLPKYADDPSKYKANGELTEEEKERQRNALLQFIKNIKPQKARG